MFVQFGVIVLKLCSLVDYDIVFGDVFVLLELVEIQLQEVVYLLLYYVQCVDFDLEWFVQVEVWFDVLYLIVCKFWLLFDMLYEEYVVCCVQFVVFDVVVDFGVFEVVQVKVWEVYFVDVKCLLKVCVQVVKVFGMVVMVGMQELLMVGGSFEVVFVLFVDGGLYGFEQVEFCVVGYLGVLLWLFVKVVLGGEFVWISFVFVVIVSVVSLMLMLIFDEVDMGIGGGVVEVVGCLLYQFGCDCQVLCVMYLLQVVVCGDYYFQVVKGVDECGGMVLIVVVFDCVNWIEEVVWMFGGFEIMVIICKYVKEMLVV